MRSKKKKILFVHIRCIRHMAYLWVMATQHEMMWMEKRKPHCDSNRVERILLWLGFDAWNLHSIKALSQHHRRHRLHDGVEWQCAITSVNANSEMVCRFILMWSGICIFVTHKISNRVEMYLEKYWLNIRIKCSIYTNLTIYSVLLK